MPTIISHGLVAATIGHLYPKAQKAPKLFLSLAVCAMAPDADVIGFFWNIPYESFWGHRGFTHSLVFAMIAGITIGILFFRKLGVWSKEWLQIVSLYIFAIASHGLLDGLTNGGKGVAFFSPLNNDRYFFPWTPIEVSPMGVSNFLSPRGLDVLASEALIIGPPMLIILLILKRKKEKS